MFHKLKSIKRRRTAVIGVGNMGKHHARVYSDISTLTAVCDVSKKVGLPIAKRYGIRFYNNYKELINKEKPEAVSIAVPTSLHKDVAIYSLKKHIPTLVEKPIAGSVKDAKCILQEARIAKTFLVIGHIERFNPAVITLKRLIEEGRLGKVLAILAIRVGILPPKVPHSDVTLELGIHDLDVSNYLLNEFPHTKKIIKNKLFSSNIADYSSMILEYKNATALIQTNWITPIKMRNLYVTGTNGFAELNYIQQKVTLYDRSIEIKKNNNYNDYSDLVRLSRTPKKEIYISKKEPLRQQLYYFLKNYASLNYSNVHYSIKALEVLTTI